MKLEIINNSTYKNIKIICDNTEYNLNNSLIVNLNYDYHIKIYIIEKNRFNFNLPAVLTSSFTHKDSWCSIICNLEFDIDEKLDAETIEINNTCLVFKKRYTFETVEVNSLGGRIKNIEYSQTDTKEIRKKHSRFNLLITSFLPVIVLNIVLCIIDQDILFLLAAIFGFCIFSIPSFFDIQKFNKICINSDITQLILQKKQ